MNVRNNSTGIGGPLAVVGAAVAMIVCCAGPALIAAGALTALGGALRSWGPIVAAAVTVLAAVGYTARRRKPPQRGTVRGLLGTRRSHQPNASTDRSSQP